MDPWTHIVNGLVTYGWICEPLLLYLWNGIMFVKIKLK